MPTQPESFSDWCERIATQRQQPDLKQEFLAHVAAYPPLDHEWMVLMYHAKTLLATRKPEDVGESA